MVNIYLIRHGRQNSPLCNVDVELSTVGREQAELLAERLSHYHIDALYSSNLLRAMQTAESINRYLKLPHEIRKEIREISFGSMEGESDEYIEKHFHSFKKEQSKLVQDIPYPEGENGAAVFERAMPVIWEIAHSGNKNIAVVTHGGTIKALLAGIVGKDQAKRFLFGNSIEHTSITQLVFSEEQERFYLERFNDFAHLEKHPELLREIKKQ